MIGIIPAAGKAERMSGLPKFLLPIPEGTLLGWHAERMQAAGVEGVALAYSDATRNWLEMNKPSNALLYLGGLTLAHTVGNARFLGGGQSVVFGMPDTYFADGDAYSKIVGGLEQGADVAVGVFETRPDQRSKLGMCHIHRHRVMEVIDKPSETNLVYAWGIIAWRPMFWDCIYSSDTTIGDALPRAIRAGLNVLAVEMDGAYYDCGTSGEYFKLIRELTGENHATE